ncbi:hypothetical protein T09_5334 [Trichinella sp. T9]|nr:hypothetical protein T09_5334 [Trichinella sp. T9]
MSAYVSAWDRQLSRCFQSPSLRHCCCCKLIFRRLGIVSCSANAVVDRRTRNDQFGQLISFISGYYVSDHAGAPSSRWIRVGILPQLTDYVNTVLVQIISCHCGRLICRECVPKMTYEVRTDASTFARSKAFHTACRLKSLDRHQLFQLFCSSKVRWMSGWSLHSFCLYHEFNGLVINPE